MNLGVKMNICNKKYKAILLIFFNVILYSFAQSGDAFSAGAPLQNTAGDKAVTAAARTETVTLTIDEAVAYARAHSRALKSADIDLEIAKRASDNAWNVFLPDVQATGTLSRTTDISGSIEQANALGVMGAAVFGTPYTPVSETESMHWAAVGNISAGVNLSLAYIGQIRAAKAGYEGGKITREQTERKTITNVKKLFFALLLQRDSLAIQRETLENARRRSVQAAVNYRNGTIPELQLLQAQVQYENQIPETEQAETSLAQQLDMFVFLLGMPSGTKIELEGSIDPSLIDMDAGDLIEKYGNSSLALRSLDNNIETLEHNLSALDFASFSPALSLNWNYQPMLRDAFDSNWFDKDNWNDNGAFSATLAWNITNMLPFSPNRQKAKDLRANLEKLKISREQLTENQKLEVRTAINTLDQAKRQIASMQRNVELAQRSYAMTLRSYQNGTTELLDLRDAERQLNQARLGLANQRYQYITALLNLEETLNTDLTIKNTAATANGGT